MLSLTEYLLTKLNEECIELADAALNLAITPSTENQKEFSDEFNDALSVIGMLSFSLNFRPEDMTGECKARITKYIDDLVVESDEHRHSKYKLIGFYSQLPNRIAKQSLAVAKMCSKCMVFGVNETYIGETLHNTERLYIEVNKLNSLIDCTSDFFSYIERSPEKQELKRQKMAKYLPISLSERVIDEECFDAFNFVCTSMR